MRVYYQAEDLTIQELQGSNTDSSWSTGSTLPGPSNSSLTPLEGTAIASVGWNGNSIHTYFQDTNNSLWEAQYNAGSWSASPVRLNVPVLLKPQTPIAAMSQYGSDVSSNLRFTDVLA